MYILDLNKLHKGDIILTRDNSRQSEVIRKRGNSDYSHVSLYVGDTVIESEGLGVQSCNPQRITGIEENDIAVLRPINASDEQIENACLFARSQCGMEYGTNDMKKSRDKTQAPTEENRQFCSRLIAQSFLYAKYPIVDNADLASIADIENSEKLQKVNKITRIANEKDIEYINSDKKTAMKPGSNVQNEAFVDFLENIRKSTNDPRCDIQNEEQLVKYIIQHPDLDDVFSEILEKSQYFRLWKEFENNEPWMYDPDLFEKKFGNKSGEYAIAEIYKPYENIKIWNIQKSTYGMLYHQFQLNLFKSFITMYQNALESFHKRMTTLCHIAQKYNAN